MCAALRRIDHDECDWVRNFICPRPWQRCEQVDVGSLSSSSTVVDLSGGIFYESYEEVKCSSRRYVFPWFSY